MKLDRSLYDQLLKDLTPLLRSGRPGDYPHIKSVYTNLVKGYERDLCSYNPRVMLPAALLHDIGFGFVKKRYMRFFTGQTKVLPMRDTIQALTLAYIPVVLQSLQFSAQEVEQVLFIVRHSDEETLSIVDPPIELVLLHDLNLYDRLLPHRLRSVRALYSDALKFEQVLKRIVPFIITPTIRHQAEKRLQTLVSSPNFEGKNS